MKKTDLSLCHLEKIQTPFGLREVYDSILFCNRCGSCLQACPIYKLSPLEINSPRGRNQAARLVLERKLNVQELALQHSFHACTLCGRCTQVCAAKIPTAQHVLEMHRILQKHRLPKSLHFFLTLQGTRPLLFKKLTRFVSALYPLWNVISWLPGFKWISLVKKRLPKKAVPLQTVLLKNNISWTSIKPKFIYMPSLEAEFLQPQIAVSSLKLLNRLGKTDCWFNTACGLFEYVYGDLRQSKRLVRNLIRKHRKIKQGTCPLVTDSLDVYHFLKQVPQLFTRHKQLYKQASLFADQVYFITEFFPKKIPNVTSFPTPVQLNYGALFSRESHPISQSTSLFKTLFKQNFVECGYTSFDTPAYGYAFTAGNQHEQILLELVKQIAQQQVKTVFTFSGLCALELNVALCRFYPAAKAHHIVSIADKV